MEGIAVVGWGFSFHIRAWFEGGEICVLGRGGWCNGMGMDEREGGKEVLGEGTVWVDGER